MIDDVEALKTEMQRINDKQTIDLTLIALSDLERFQSAQPVIINMVGLYNGLVVEYSQKYPNQKDYVFPKPQEKTEIEPKHSE